MPGEYLPQVRGVPASGPGRVPAFGPEGVLASGPGGGGVYPSMQWGKTLPVNRMTDRCKNITLPQTSFAGGNKYQTVWNDSRRYRHEAN